MFSLKERIIKFYTKIEEAIIPNNHLRYSPIKDDTNTKVLTSTPPLEEYCPRPTLELPIQRDPNKKRYFVPESKIGSYFLADENFKVKNNKGSK